MELSCGRTLLAMNNTRLGLGCMGMSGMYGATTDAEGIRTIHAAIDAGVTLLDTGDFYGMGHNEMLVGRAIEGRRDRVQLSVKFGAMRGPDNAWIGMDTRPVAIKNFLAYSLKRLGVEHIDIYRPSRLDPTVPIEDTVGTIADLIKAGYVKQIGLSEVSADTVRRAIKVHPIADLQIEYSIASRAPEAKIFPALREMGVSATLYGVYSRGLLTGSKPQGRGDFRAYLPRFAGDNAGANAAIIQKLRAFADGLKMTPAQVLVGWTLAKQPGFMPLIGARTEAQLRDALAARELSPTEVAAVEAIIPVGAVAGDRYAPEAMKHLDSER
jgi:aryl-alcohol dehydrogenase-like predicted oxidoreductase